MIMRRPYYLPLGPWKLVLEYLMRDPRQSRLKRRVAERINAFPRSIMGFCADMSDANLFRVKHDYVLTTPVAALLMEDICALSLVKIDELRPAEPVHD